MAELPKQLADEFSNQHILADELGRGGQGVVLRTKDPDIAIKLILDKDGRPLEAAEVIRRMHRLRALPIPDDLHLSAPAAVLRDLGGYAMRLLDEMVPFSTFLSKRIPDADPAEAGIPAWLSTAPPDLAMTLLGYRDSGGLRRRLLALYKCAAVLARVHGAGLVYGDVSLNNSFISRDPASRAVWLIDGDNLRFETPASRAVVFTPGFGAPELVQGLDGIRPRTDCHAFGVMAFSMLSTHHPFIGDYVEAGDGGDWADEEPSGEDLDAQAYAGLIPWVHDLEDDRNHSTHGIPRPLVCTDELMALFQWTFGVGRTRPALRPTIFRWPPALARALDRTVRCAYCAMEHYWVTESPGAPCPYCGSDTPALLRADAIRCGEDAGHPSWTYVREWEIERPLRLPRRVFLPFSMRSGDEDLLELVSDGDELLVRVLQRDSGLPFAVAISGEADGAFKDFVSQAVLPRDSLGEGIWLRVGGRAPTVVRLKMQQGAG